MRIQQSLVVTLLRGPNDVSQHTRQVLSSEKNKTAEKKKKKKIVDAITRIQHLLLTTNVNKN